MRETHQELKEQKVRERSSRLADQYEEYNKVAASFYNLLQAKVGESAGFIESCLIEVGDKRVWIKLYSDKGFTPEVMDNINSGGWAVNESGSVLEYVEGEKKVVDTMVVTLEKEDVVVP